MNKKRRAEIAAIIAVLQKAQSSDDVVDVESDVRGVLDDEKTCLDAMPENLEGSERYEAMEDAVSSLEDALDYIEDAIEYYEEDNDIQKFNDAVASAISSLEAAAE